MTNVMWYLLPCFIIGWIINSWACNKDESYAKNRYYNYFLTLFWVGIFAMMIGAVVTLVYTFIDVFDMDIMAAGALVGITGLAGGSVLGMLGKKEER